MDGSVSRDEFIQVLNYFHYYIDGVELDKLLMRQVVIVYLLTFGFIRKNYIEIPKKYQFRKFRKLRNCGTPLQYSVIKSLTNNNSRCLFSGILKAIICLCDFLQQTLDKGPFTCIMFLSIIKTILLFVQCWASLIQRHFICGIHKNVWDIKQTNRIETINSTHTNFNNEKLGK